MQDNEEIDYTKEYHSNNNCEYKGCVDYKGNKICFWVTKFCAQTEDEYTTKIHITCGKNFPVLSYSFLSGTQELSKRIAEIYIEELKGNPKNLWKTFKERS